MWQRSLDLKKRWRAGAVTYGAFLCLADPVVAEIMAMTGFDFIIIDIGHGAHSQASLPATLMAFSGQPTVTIVRVPWNDPAIIKRVLDAGADGITAPMIMNADDTRALVSACLYPPDGERGFGPWRASAYGKNIDEYAALANESLIVMPLIEHVDAAARADEIVSVPGVAAILIGPQDMSGSAKVLRQVDHPSVVEGVDRVIRAAAKAGIPACVGAAPEPEESVRMAERGATMVTVTEDIDLLTVGAAEALRAMKAAAPASA